MENYLYDGFINEAKKALDRHAGGGGTAIPETIILVDQDGNECAAVLTNEEIELTATTNDIREGMVAVTENGVEVGEKFIPSYHVREGVRLVAPGGALNLVTPTHYDYKKLQMIICQFNTVPSDSVAAEKVVIDDKVYNVNSTEPISTVTKDSDNWRIDLGITNETSNKYLLRYFMYKEIY